MSDGLDVRAVHTEDFARIVCRLYEQSDPALRELAIELQDVDTGEVAMRACVLDGEWFVDFGAYERTAASRSAEHANALVNAAVEALVRRLPAGRQ